MIEATETARFQDKRVHLFRERAPSGYGVTYCGLSERGEIWSEPEEGVTCGHCLRRLVERVNEMGTKFLQG